MPCEEMTLARISPSGVTSAAQVSSQLVSIARITAPGAVGVTGPAAGMSSSDPFSVAGVRHMMSASSPLSW